MYNKYTKENIEIGDLVSTPFYKPYNIIGFVQSFMYVKQTDEKKYCKVVWFNNMANKFNRIYSFKELVKIS